MHDLGDYISSLMRIIAKPEVSKLKRTHIKSKIGPPGIILERPKYDPQS